MMFRFLLKPRSLFVLSVFLYASFVLNFYDGYRKIYAVANALPLLTDTQTSLEQNPEASLKLRPDVEKARTQYFESFISWSEDLRRRKLNTFARAGDDRHRLRWLYVWVQATIYQAVGDVAGPVYANYARFLHDGLWMTLSLVFVFLSVAWIKGRPDDRTLAGMAIALFAFCAFMISAPAKAGPFSLIEIGVMSAGIYFSLRQKLIWFLFFLFIAVANRETGAAMGMIYAIINWRQGLFWLPVILGPLFIVGINYELLLLTEFYETDTYMVSKEWGYVTLYNLDKIPLKRIVFTFSLLLLVLSPLVLIYHRVKDNPLAVRIALVEAMYFVILLGGTIIGNLYAYLLLVPPIMILGGLAYSDRELTGDD